MRYEKRNNLGFFLLIIGGAIGCLSLLLTSGGTLIACVIVSLVMIGGGFYMMTRAFTEVDIDHPDYEQYQQRIEEAKQIDQQDWNK